MYNKTKKILVKLQKNINIPANNQVVRHNIIWKKTKKYSLLVGVPKFQGHCTSLWTVSQIWETQRHHNLETN